MGFKQFEIYRFLDFVRRVYRFPFYRSLSILIIIEIYDFFLKFSSFFGETSGRKLEKRDHESLSNILDEKIAIEIGRVKKRP